MATYVCLRLWYPHGRFPELPLTFEWKAKKLVMRSAVFNNGSHFVTLTRTPTEWMYYDRRNDAGDCFQFYSIDDYERAFSGTTIPYKLAYVTYEVVHNDEETDFGDPMHDWRKSFECSNQIQREEDLKASKIRLMPWPMLSYRESSTTHPSQKHC